MLHNDLSATIFSMDLFLFEFMYFFFWNIYFQY